MGFGAWVYAGRVSLYGLTDENYTDYISDFDYFRVHPFNNHFAIWINDKVTLKYTIPSMFRTLEGRDLSIMPEYYLYIENDGYYSYLMDSPQQLLRDEDYLLNLLKDKKTLALKPSRGTCGYGFVRLEYDDGMIRANGKVLDEQAFKKFEKGLNGYIVTEYIYQHPLLDRVWKDSVCTLRVIALKNRQDIFDGGRIDVIASYARFGTNKSHGASNLSSGGVGVPYNFDNGIFGENFYQHLKYADNGCLTSAVHPDTKVSLRGEKLPHWEIVRDVVYSVCDYFSSLEYFGFDIMITEEGVKICEINTLPDLSDSQMMRGPIFTYEKAAQYFNKKIGEASHL